jgi:hypothetical protein
MPKSGRRTKCTRSHPMRRIIVSWYIDYLDRCVMLHQLTCSRQYIDYLDRCYAVSTDLYSSVYQLSRPLLCCIN